MTTREEWLAGAEQRRAEPLRPDDPAEIRARLVPAVRYRPGGSWAAKGGLCTLVAYDPAEPADGQGRRPSDRCVGLVADPDLALALCQAFNDRDGVAERIAAARRRWTDGTSDEYRRGLAHAEIIARTRSLAEAADRIAGEPPA